MKNDKSLKIKTFGLFVGVAFIGFMANQTGFGGLSGQGVGGEEQVGCGGDMSGFAIGHDENGTATLQQAEIVDEDKFYVNDSEWLNAFANDQERVYRAEGVSGDCADEIQTMAGTAERDDVYGVLSCIFRLSSPEQKTQAFENFAQVAGGEGIQDYEELQARLGFTFISEVESAADMGVQHPGLNSDGRELKGVFDGPNKSFNWCGPNKGRCQRDDPNGQCGDSNGGPAKSKADAACRTHDDCYAAGTDKNTCDTALLNADKSGSCNRKPSGREDGTKLNWGDRWKCRTYLVSLNSLFWIKSNF